MVAATAPDQSRDYPVTIHNLVAGTCGEFYSGRTRGEIIESFLWGTYRSEIDHEDVLTDSESEPFNVVMQITPDQIVMRLYSDFGNSDAAREAIERFIQGLGGPTS